ncbi:MAG: hypothetical protein IIY82_02570 [Firmicutes bacterium]|nr:hypothetical protein [Bacillota bacterium]
MEINRFTELIRAELQDRLKNEKEENSFRLEQETVLRPNGIVEPVVMLRETGDEEGPMPSVRLREYYDRYGRGETMRELADEIWGRLTVNLFRMPIRKAVQAMEDYEHCRRHTIFRIMDVERNREYLEDKVHFPCGPGLTLVCNIRVTMGGEEWRTPFARHTLEQMQVTEETVYMDTLLNTRQWMPATIVPLAQVLEEEQPLLVHEVTGKLDDEEVYVVGGKERRFGATAFFCRDVPEQIGRLLGGSYYIIPSSVHEVLIIPAAMEPDVDRLNEVLREANREVVGPEEYLAGQVLFYDQETEELRIA